MMHVEHALPLAMEHSNLAGHTETFQLVILLPLHAPVLEPDLDLTFTKAQGVGDLDAPPPSQVAVEVELLLELQGLVTCVGRS